MSKNIQASPANMSISSSIKTLTTLASCLNLNTEARNRSDPTDRTDQNFQTASA
jgi:hypothetical protein